MVDAAGSHDGVVTTRMVRFAATLSQGFAIDVEGVVSLPESGRPPLATTQQVEIQVRKLHPIGRGVHSSHRIGNLRGLAKASPRDLLLSSWRWRIIWWKERENQAPVLSYMYSNFTSGEKQFYKLVLPEFQIIGLFSFVLNQNSVFFYQLTN